MVGAFTWGSGGQAVPSEEAMRRRARISEILLQNALSGQPAQHWSDGIAKGVNILAAGYFDKQNRDAEQTGKQGLQASIAQMLGGEAAPAAAPQGGGNPLAGVQPMAMGSDLDRAANAITSIESGGRYDALGPVTKSGDRAFGRYQVMGENIPSWTEQYVGRRMTPQEFLASQEAQDAVFRGEFGRLKQKHGPEGAARAWFAGEGGMNNPNAKDILGTSVSDYSRKFTSAFAPGGGQAPQVAQASGATPQAPAAPVAAPQAQGGITQDRLRAAYNVMNSPFAGPADKAIAQTIIQRALTAETKDPLDARLKQLQVQQAEAQIGLTPLQRRQQEIAVQKGERELQGEGATPLTPEERTQIGVPEGQPAYKTRTGEIKFGPAGTKITNDLRQESAFGKATGEAIAKRFDEMATEGDAAAQNLDAINQLKALGTNIGTGGPAVIKAFLGKIGIKTEGISDIEAFNSLIDRLTPQQRVPGSGATSDFDAKMFKGALPTLINTPGGNAIIIDTMEKIVQNRMARGDIAIRAQLPKDDPDHLSQGQALREIRKLQVEAKKASDAVQNFGQPSRSTTPAPQNAPATSPANGGFRILKVE